MSEMVSVSVALLSGVVVFHEDSDPNSTVFDIMVKVEDASHISTLCQALVYKETLLTSTTVLRDIDASQTSFSLNLVVSISNLTKNLSSQGFEGDEHRRKTGSSDCSHISQDRLLSISRAMKSSVLQQSEEAGHDFARAYSNQYHADIRAFAVAALPLVCRRDDERVQLILRRRLSDGGHPIHGSQTAKRRDHPVRLAAVKAMTELALPGAPLAACKADFMREIGRCSMREQDPKVVAEMIASLYSLATLHPLGEPEQQALGRVVVWHIRAHMRKENKSNKGKNKLGEQAQGAVLPLLELLLGRVPQEMFATMLRGLLPSSNLARWPTPQAFMSFHTTLTQAVAKRRDPWVFDYLMALANGSEEESTWMLATELCLAWRHLPTNAGAWLWKRARRANFFKAQLDALYAETSPTQF